MRRCVVIALVAALGVPAAQAQEAPTAQRRVDVQWSSGTPALSFSALDFAERTVRAKLQSGLPQTLVMRVYAYGDNGTPLAVAVRSCRIVYDLWEEVYRLQYQTAQEDRSESHASLDGVLGRCLRVEGMPLGRPSDYARARGGGVYFGVLIELNPLSPDTVHRLRRWLARPAGSARVGGEAFFGSFVSLFVNRQIGAAERSLGFRSQSARVP